MWKLIHENIGETLHNMRVVQEESTLKANLRLIEQSLWSGIPRLA